MATRDEQRAERVRRQLAKLLGEDGGFLPGSIVSRSIRCGKANCACKLLQSPQLHGPYVQWSYSYRNKRFTRWFSEDQLERYRSQIDRGRRLKQLLVELDQAEIQRAERAEGWGT